MPNSDARNITIIANWKMNPGSFFEASELIKAVKNGIKKSENVNVVICPPAVYLSKIKPNAKFELGIQNIFWENRGAYTGEISAKMAKNLGVSYAIIGHSERRQYLGETDEMINLKIKSAMENNLNSVLCIGETLDEKKKDKTSEVIVRQLEKALNNISISYAFCESAKGGQIPNSKFQIVYEPIWAIGTGETPTTDEIMSIVLLIRKVIAKFYGREIAEKISILYGGSVDSQNACDFVRKANTDGLLIGGASLNASEFARIVNLFG